MYYLFFHMCYLTSYNAERVIKISWEGTTRKAPKKATQGSDNGKKWRAESCEEMAYGSFPWPAPKGCGSHCVPQVTLNLLGLSDPLVPAS